MIFKIQKFVYIMHLTILFFKNMKYFILQIYVLIIGIQKFVNRKLHYINKSSTKITSSFFLFTLNLWHKKNNTSLSLKKQKIKNMTFLFHLWETIVYWTNFLGAAAFVRNGNNFRDKFSNCMHNIWPEPIFDNGNINGEETFSGF